MEAQSVAAVILAAGLGRRFGGPKALATLGGETLLARVVAIARRAGLSPVIAVVPVHVPAPAGARAVVNPGPDRGLSSSIQLGIVAVPPGQAALLLLVDQPTMRPETIRAVLATRGRRPILAASAEGRLGPPVLLEPEAFSLTMTLTGDIGLREVMAAQPELVEAVPVAAHPLDVDTPADLERLEARLGA